MKLTLILDQIQAGLGTKDDAMMALGGKTTAIGPALMMEQFLKKEEIEVNACLYCGDGYFKTNPTEVTEKIKTMTTKLQSDIILCGPCFDFAGYAQMAIELCLALTNAGQKAFVALALNKNEALIDQYKEQILMVKMPKKGAVGLNGALEHICRFAKALYTDSINDQLKKELCF